MRLGGRLSAAIDILSDIEARRRPVADALKDWGLSHRFAGSGDRAAIGNIVYDALRRKRSFGFRMEDEGARALAVAAVLDGLAWNGRSGQGAGGRPVRAGSPVLRRLRRLADPRTRCGAGGRARRRAGLARGTVRARLRRGLGRRGGRNVRSSAARSSRQHAEGRPCQGAEGARAVPCRATPLAPEGVRIAPIARDGRHPNVQVEAGFQKGWFEMQDEGSQIAAPARGRAAGRAGARSLRRRRRQDAGALGGDGEHRPDPCDRFRSPAPRADPRAAEAGRGPQRPGPRSPRRPVRSA